MLRKYWGVLAAVLSGVMLAMCFPGYDVGGFVWVWAMPLMVALWSGVGERKLKRRGFFVGWMSGVVFWLMTVNWLLAMGELDTVPAVGAWFAWIGLSVYLALYFGVWGIFLATVGNPWRGKNVDVVEGKKSRIDVLVEEKLAGDKKGKRFDLMGGFGTSMRVMRFAVMHASLWVVLEWLRGWLFTGFTWNGLGVAFHENATMAQAADLVGVVGLSFLPMLVCSMLVQLGKRLVDEARDGGKFKAHWEIAFTVGLVAMSFVYGVVKMGECRQSEKLAVRVLLLQPNISQNDKWGDEIQQVKNYEWFAREVMEAFGTMQNDAIERSAETGEAQEPEVPDVVILPESALTHGLIYEDTIKNAFLLPMADQILRYDLLDRGEHSVIFGSNFYEGETQDYGMGPQIGMKMGGRDYNAIAIAGPRVEVENVDDDEKNYAVSKLDIYGKVHLVPFGEYFPDIPFRDGIYGALYGSNPGSNFTKGTSFDPLPLQVGDVEVGVIPAVCFEDSVGRVTRKFVRDAPQMIVNVTNDGWFGESKAARQHMANARFRAIELRRPMVRCANTGVSCIIDTAGGVVDDVTKRRQVLEDANGSIFTDGNLFGHVRVPVNPRWTLYALAGDWFVILCAFMGVGMIVIGRGKN
ncbi:MAG: apolipoprotein N-acyltransferase [Akkermansiaceae bacterium]